MANIEYRTNEEHLIMKDINLNLASIEEVDNYKKKMFTRASYCESQIEIILKNDHSYDEIAVESHLEKIILGAAYSDPFDDEDGDESINVNDKELDDLKDLLLTSYNNIKNNLS